MGTIDIKYGVGQLDKYNWTTAKRTDLNRFDPSLLGLGDVAVDAKVINALAAVFDLEGFTDFCGQPDPQLVIPDYLSEFLVWLFEAITNRFKKGEKEGIVFLSSTLPFFAKFMGDGVLFLWNTDQVKTGHMGIGNITVCLHDICKRYSSTFLKKAINHQLSSNKKTLSELSVNRYVLFDKLSEVINGLLEKQSKKRFDEFLKKGKVKVKKFEAFPDKITLKQLIPQEYAKNLYANIDKLNKEEAGFVGRLDLDNLPNIKYWVRSREKVDPFYIQGWKKNKFYPDFVAVTKKGNAIALEWKGGDRISNDDTTYKVEIGDLWAKLGGSKLHFLLVHNGNIERILTALKTL